MTLPGRAVSLGVAFLAVITGVASAEITLSWEADPDRPLDATVHCRGIPKASLEAIPTALYTLRDWQGIMPVRIDQPESSIAADLPPMAGTYEVTGKEMIFKPRFPLQRGVRYTAVFDPTALPVEPSTEEAITAAVLEVAKLQMAPTTTVANVYPDNEVLPENTLKFYLHFSSPMSGGSIYQHVRILSEAGDPIPNPFLELDQEMWNPAMTRLTLFIDPGRIKHELAPRADLGPVFEFGKKFTLEIDAAWKDALGQSLAKGFRKTFLSGPADETSPNPEDWVLSVPTGSKPLQVQFDEPLDHALALRLLSIWNDAGELAGKSKLTNQGTSWSFLPDQPWQPGRYQLHAPDILEDLAGNSVGKPFEVDLFTSADPPDPVKIVKIPFVIE